jgi:hypothetical protein
MNSTTENTLLYELNHQNNSENDNNILNVKFNKTCSKIISNTSVNVYIWNVSNMSCIEKMNFPSFKVTYICFNENNDTEIVIGLISIDDKGSFHNKSQIRIYNILTMDCMKILYGHENNITNIIFTNKFIITESCLFYDSNYNKSIFNAVMMWESNTCDFNLIGSLNKHISHKSFKYRLSSDNSLISVYNPLSCLSINPLIIFNSNLTEFAQCGNNVVNMNWSNDNSVFIIQEADGSLDCIELKKPFRHLLKLNLDNVSIKRYGNNKLLINNFHFSPNGNFLAIKHGNFIRMWKFKREKYKTSIITEHEENIVKKIKDIDPPNGSGRKNFPCGSVYIGQFKSKHRKNTPHGRGIKSCADGTILNGNWKNGIFLGKLDVNNSKTIESVVNESVRVATGLNTTNISSFLARNTKSKKSVLLSRTASTNGLNKHSSQANIRSLNNIARVKNILEELENDKLEVKQQVKIASKSFNKSRNINKTMDKCNMYPYKLLINGSHIEVMYKNNWYN